MRTITTFGFVVACLTILPLLVAGCGSMPEQTLETVQPSEENLDIKTLRQGAEQGDAGAQSILGVMYVTGEGVPQDYREAAKWSRLAADQGNAVAQASLGARYHTGEGVIQDNREAFIWASLAAVNGEEIFTKPHDMIAKYLSSDEHRAAQTEAKRRLQVITLTPEQESLVREYFDRNDTGMDYDQFRSKAYQVSKDNPKFFGQMASEVKSSKLQGQLPPNIPSRALADTYYRNIGNRQTDLPREEFVSRFLQVGQTDRTLEGRAALELYPLYQHRMTRVEFNEQFGIGTLAGAEDARSADKASETEIPNMAFIPITPITLPAPQQSAAQRAFEHGWRSVVVLTTSDGQGSGVIIRPNVVATNCHVVEDDSDIAVYKAENHRANTDAPHSARIRLADRKRDLCLLDVSELWGVPAQIREAKSLSIGEAVYAIGAPHGLDFSLSAGVVSQLRTDTGDAPVIQTDAAISPGSSGGGLFDTSGNLVGITTRKISDGEITFAIPAEWILEMR